MESVHKTLLVGQFQYSEMHHNHSNGNFR